MTKDDQKKLSTLLLSLGVLMLLLCIGMLLRSLRPSEGEVKKSSIVMPIALIPVGIGLWTIGSTLRSRSKG
jgi:hypothetical protein